MVAILMGARAHAAPVDAAPRVQLDPEIQAAVAQVSPERIERTIRTLVGFGTRNTLSETTSETRGIGAARRWLAAEFERCARASGGRLKVTLDEHVTPVGPRVPVPTPLVNIVATLEGTDPASRDRVLVMSGHYDSIPSDPVDAVSDAPGADDDASGVAAALEAACVLSQRSFKATLVFMAVAGEEQGLLGSEHWAAQAHARGTRIEAMITNDIIGTPVGDHGQRDAHRVRLFADGGLMLLALSDARADPALRKQLETQVRAGGIDDLPPNQLGRHLKAAGEAYVPGFTVDVIRRYDRFLRGGDHMPFQQRGDAAVRFTEPFETFAHQHQNVRVDHDVQYGDLPQYVDARYVADVTRVNLAGLASLARAPAPPANARIELVALTNDTTLRWDPGADEVAGYRIVWRSTAAAEWQHARDVGDVTHVTLDVSKDNVVFGVQALDRDGHASLVSYPLPARK